MAEVTIRNISKVDVPYDLQSGTAQNVKRLCRVFTDVNEHLIIID